MTVNLVDLESTKRHTTSGSSLGCSPEGLMGGGGSQSWHFPKQPSYGGLWGSQCVCAPLPLPVHSSVTHCHCHPPVTSESSSSDLQQGLKVSGNLQAIHARLEPHQTPSLVDCTATQFSVFQCTNHHCWITKYICCRPI